MSSAHVPLPGCRGARRHAAAFGNGLYVVADASWRFLYSPTGVDYRVAFTSLDPLAESQNDLAFRDGLFVSVGRSGTIAHSRDGQVWTRRTTSVTEALYGVCVPPGAVP